MICSLSERYSEQFFQHLTLVMVLLVIIALIALNHWGEYPKFLSESNTSIKFCAHL